MLKPLAKTASMPLSRPALLIALMMSAGTLLFLYSGHLLALEEGDKVRELAGLTTETSKIVKNGCYIAGSASALVGAIWSVASQSLKVAASSAAITIVALKAAGFFAGTLVI
jgi:hypothetical protein